MQWKLFLFFKRFYLFILESVKEEERKGEKKQCVVASRAPPNRDLAHNPGMSPDWESNQQPFDLQAGTQSTEGHHLGIKITFIVLGCIKF